MIRLLVLLQLQVGPGPLELLRLEEARPGPGLPAGWKVRPVKGRPAPQIAIRQDDDGPVLRLHGSGRAAWIYRELVPPIQATAGSVRWTWRVLEAPATADLRRKDADDSPIRIYVVFGNPGALLGGSGRIIFYSFGNAEAGGYEGTSHVNGRFHSIRVDGAADLGTWRSHSVSVFEDYQRIWRRNPPPITAIGIMQDTDQTGSHAVAELRRLEWIPNSTSPATFPTR